MSRASQPKASLPGLLIVDHGTRSTTANAPLAELARKIGSQRPGWVVEHAHMELAEPRFHVRKTIPQLVASARERHPAVSIETTAPLGDDERLVEIVLDRMDAQSDPDRQSS